MQGVFGLNSNNLIESSSKFDKKGNLTFSQDYTFKFENARITEYEETIGGHFTTNYKVNWTGK